MRPEDQRAINTFGRLNNRKHDIEDEIKEKQSFHDLLDDASNEMILADEDEPVRYVPPFLTVPACAVHLLSRPCLPGHRYGFGECYFECNKDQAEELLDKQKEDTVKEIAVLNGELNGIHDTLSGLKTQLCARPPSKPSHTLSPRHHTLATHDSPAENEHAVGRAHLRLLCWQIWPLRQQHQSGGDAR